MVRRIVAVVAVIAGGCGESPVPLQVGEAESAAALEIRRSVEFRRPKRPDPVPIEARPCRDDAFFIDIPTSAVVPASAVAGVSAAAAKVQDQANGAGFPWFCDGSKCGITEVTVSMESVLEPRAHKGWRADGHERFHRLRFLDTASERVLKVLPAARCEVVSFIRNEFSNEMSVAPEVLFVGRVCDATGLGVAAFATQEMLSWHRDRTALGGEAVAEPGLVDLALIDGGVEPAVAASLGVASTQDFTRDGSTTLHPHGTAMAILSAEANSSAAIHDLRVLDAGGFALPSSVAQAFDHALFGLQSDGRPLIVNMSLGWAPQLGARAGLTGPSCSTHEDPVGEPLRYLMRGSAERADLAVFSAAGNQPTKVPSTLFPAAGWPAPICTNGAAEQWFYPARWSREATCQPGEVDGETFGIAVSGVNDEEQPFALAIPNGESALVAPAQHVYAQNAAGAPAPSTPNCSGVPVSPGFTSPMPMTGTSAATALTSGLAARAAALARLYDRPFRAAGAYQAVYASGEATGRHTTAGDPVRRIHAGRLESLLSGSEECAIALECVQAVSGPPGANTLAICGGALTQCLGPDAPVTGKKVEWPAGFPSENQICRRVSAPVTFIDVNSCSGSCSFELLPFRSVLGTTGPQPEGAGCLDCWGGGNVMMMMMDESGAPAVHYNPHLVVSGYNQSTQKTEQHFAALPVASIAPGESVAVDVPFSSLPLDPSSISVVLTSTVDAAGLQGTHVSPVRFSP